ncbi:MAG: GNAT family N-acetyltransferase [Candidatus Woesearchaeota archaeon]|jgi:ribosomal protein S18 acetylase RimI-like enzyme
MIIRPATLDDFEEIYRIGNDTPEFKVSSTEPFIDREDLELRITGEEDLLLLAEEKEKILGFILFGLKDKDRPLKNRSACLTYLVVLPEYRGSGIASQLYDTSVSMLRERGVMNLYSWANAETDGSMISFLKKRGFDVGHQYVWMDKKIE